MMTPERWQQIESLVQAALEQPTAARSAFLQQACNGDADLLSEVEELLAEYQVEDEFLAAPPAEVAAAIVSRNSTAEFAPGHKLARYELQRVLGRGGMGTVYLAHDTQLGRQVALKLLSPAAVADADRVRRFRQEARAVSALNHPNILTLYELGTAPHEAGGATQFIATEYVEGRTLRALLNAGALTLGTALDLAAQTASALAAAHDAGIIHRDIKPENLMVRPDGLVKVLDFGIAKLTARKTLADTRASFSTINTNPGMLLGTVSYMSPEQARGLELDGRSDLFSLGVVLYEMLTGRAPFSGATTGDVLVAILNRAAPALNQCAPALPAALQGILDRALAKECAQRYARAADFRAHLQELQAELQHAARLKRAGEPAGQVSLSVPLGQTALAENAASADAAPTAAMRTVHRARWTRALGLLQRHRRLALSGLSVLALVTALAVWLPRGWRAPAEINSIAVLPFANADGDAQMAYLADGLTENLIDSLARLPALRVSAHSTVAPYKGRAIDPRQAGQELQVNAVLTGRVAWQGERFIIRVELADAAHGARLWSEEFQRARTQLVAVQGEITREIAAKLHRQLSPASQQQIAKRHSPDSRAYELYAQGRDWLQRYDQASLEKAVETFRQATLLDPRYALAFSGLADSYAGFSSQYKPPGQVIPPAREAALHALELDETLPEAHYSLALIKLWGDWDWAGAEREYRRALQLNPNFVTARIYYAEMLADQRRFEEALREIQLAEQTDPASRQAQGREGYIHFQMGQYARAVAVYQKMLAAQPNLTGIQRDLALVFSLQGRHAEALAQMEQLQKYPSMLIARTYISARAGQRNEALKLLQEVKARAARETIPSLTLARLYTALEDKEQAFAWLRKGLEERSDHLLHLAADPLLEPLRADPRFAELARETGLTP